MSKMHFSLLRALVALLAAGSAFAAIPQVGELAPDFTLKTLDDKAVTLSEARTSGPVVLIVLRGWPGYQCPICTRQVHDFVQHAADFAAAETRVVMVYPGPAENLKAHAQEFLQDKTWPKEFIYLIDPDYAFTRAYDLRWEANRETAYPSTFIIAKDGKIKFAEVSHTHGGRASAAKVLEALAAAGK